MIANGRAIQNRIIQRNEYHGLSGFSFIASF
jgi:hypothetical protein